MIYSFEQLSKMSDNAQLNIISIKTSDDIRIFFDDMIDINFDQIRLKGGATVPILGQKAYDRIVKKYAEYKLFKVVHDPSGKYLQNDQLLKTKVENLELQFEIKTEEMFNQIEKEFKYLQKTLLVDNIIPTLKGINSTLENSINNFNKELKKINERVEKIPVDEIEETINKLARITTLLEDVVDDD